VPIHSGLKPAPAEHREVLTSGSLGTSASIGGGRELVPDLRGREFITRLSG
jgi:hypothetical protein